jgi:AcrR family transcriptional regulator
MHLLDADGRPYHSRLREEQAEATRGRILDATLRVMARGIAGLSVPAVAREAGVSVPTIYRHFGAKHGLFAAVYPHVARRAGLPRLEDLEGPRSLDGLRDGLRAVYVRMESVGADELAAAAFSGPGAEEVRRTDIPKRRAAFRRFADTTMPGLGEVERDRVARLLVVLTTSSAMRIWREHLGSSADEAADDVAWVVRSAVAGAGAATSRREEGRR